MILPMKNITTANTAKQTSDGKKLPKYSAVYTEPASETPINSNELINTLMRFATSGNAANTIMNKLP